MPATRKCGVQENVDEPERGVRVRQPFAKRQDVGVIVFRASGAQRLFGDRSGPYAWDLVRGDGHADAESADEDAAGRRRPRGPAPATFEA